MTGDNTKSSSPEKSPYGKQSLLTYNNYLKVKELKTLQICESQPSHHDEPLFIIIHQTYELWFKLILHELDEVAALLEAGRARRALWFLKRIVSIMRLLVGQIHILETMTPQDFLGFRNLLNPASGFQSSQFREIEVACGLRDAALMEHFRNDEEAYASIKRRATSPSLQHHFYNLLRLRGFTMPELEETDVPRQLTPDDQKQSEQFENERVQELRKLYEETEKYGELYDIAESLVDLDEQIFLWRMHHVTVVERIIGFKRGTGGSEGVGYLRSTLTKRCFPDLWKVRTEIRA